MSTPAEALRPSLFGDLPMEAWPAGDEPRGEPWDGFVRARRHWADGDQDLAAREWITISGFDNHETRHQLQAWHFLRAMNINPDVSFAGEAWGVVAEVAVDDGHDVLATYRDGTIRFLHHQGGVSVIDAPPIEVADAAARYLAAARVVGGAIGPWEEPALPPLPVGQRRFTMLTAGGHRFGQGADDVLRQDPLAESLFAAATALFVQVVDLATTADPSVQQLDPDDPS